MPGTGDVRAAPNFQGVRLLAEDVSTSGPWISQAWCRNMAGHLQWKVMAGSVTWSRLSGAPGGQSKIVVEADFGDILPQMHLRSRWSS